MRLRSSVKLARPYIWRLTALTLLTMPSTLPELHGRVSPLRTASLSMRIPVAKERSSGWPSAASTAASQGSRYAVPVSPSIISANAVMWPARASMCGHPARIAASCSCSPGSRWSGQVSRRRVICRAFGTAGGAEGAVPGSRNCAR